MTLTLTIASHTTYAHSSLISVLLSMSHKLCYGVSCGATVRQLMHKELGQIRISLLCIASVTCGVGIYRRSGNFRVKYTSPFNFSRCFIFVARAHRRKLNHAKILFTRTRARSRSQDRIPCRAIGEKLEPRISASEGMQQTPMPYHW